MSIIYDDEHMAVHFQDGSTDYLLATFNPAVMPPNAAFWGQPLVAKLGCGALGFMSKSPNWFPARSMQAALAEAAPLIAKFPHLITYGFSLGAYGALKHAKLLNAELTMAFSPQSPTIRAATPFTLESRTPRAFDGLDVTGADLGPRTFIFFDPLEAIDKRTVANIVATAPDCELIRTYASGHSSLVPFIKTGLIGKVIDACRADDRAKLRALWAQARRASPTRPVNVAIYAAEKHPGIAEELYRRTPARFDAEEATELHLALTKTWVRRGQLAPAQAALLAASKHAGQIQRFIRPVQDAHAAVAALGARSAKAAAAC